MEVHMLRLLVPLNRDLDCSMHFKLDLDCSMHFKMVVNVVNANALSDQANFNLHCDRLQQVKVGLYFNLMAIGFGTILTDLHLCLVFPTDYLK